LLRRRAAPRAGRAGAQPEDSIVASKRKTKRAKTPGAGGPIADRGLHGEGNYQASREYNQATRDFVNAGRVRDAAREAAPHSPEEAAALDEAERAGRMRSRGEDPLGQAPAGDRAGKRDD
jgi:hypothetical protein